MQQANLGEAACPHPNAEHPNNNVALSVVKNFPTSAAAGNNLTPYFM